MHTDSIIELRSVTKEFSGLKAVDQIDLNIADGEIFVLVGGSGSGKTTTLKLLNGLLRPDSGDILYEGEALKDLDIVSHRRKMGYAIQGSGLFPHMRIVDNVGVIAKRVGWSKQEIMSRATELLELVDLDPKDTLRKFPHQLSGGQQQRVGIIRALFLSPRVLLMDEAFGALDPITRKEIQKEFLRLHKKIGFTSVIVTHDLSEAFKLGSRICLMNKGKVEQVGSPNSLLLKPKSQYVKDFVTSHSPGQMLEDIDLYSVINTDLIRVEKQGDRFRVYHIEEARVLKENSNYKEVIQLHNEYGQSLIYLCHQNGSLESVFQKGDFDGAQKALKLPRLSSTQNFLEGLRVLMESPSAQIPVVNEEGVFKGVFSEHAITTL